jgi:ubiquinone/menaquinone biosynthesis C-methylase UbiE
MASRATRSELLEQRIAENASAQQIDLTTWIFARAAVKPNDRVLELCCGTGGQTLKILELLGEAGRVVALDVSRNALDTLVSKVGPVYGSKLTLIEGGLDDLTRPLKNAGLHAPSFDLIFCAYGLYYSADAARTLDEARSWLNPGGRMVVVGPFGPNNKPLFDMLRASGVTIPDPVIASSEHFMIETLLPWAARNFECISLHTMVNRVPWSAPERVLNYWQNTTFYDAEKRGAFENLLRRHFERHGQFVNEKWVMLAEMTDARC